MSRKVIITCAITGSVHTPSMSQHLPITPTRLPIRRLRRQMPGCHPASACTRSRNRLSKPGTRNFQPIPAAHQIGHRCGDQYFDRRRHDHDGQGPYSCGKAGSTRNGVIEYGDDEFRLVPGACRAQRLETRLGTEISKTVVILFSKTRFPISKPFWQISAMPMAQGLNLNVMTSGIFIRWPILLIAA